ncbi:MAG: P-loop NTPase, partial [Rhodothalassiaceae bacterium]
MAITRDAIVKALARIVDPARGSDIVSLGYVSGLVVRDGDVGFALDLGDDPRAADKEPLREAAEKAVRALPGVQSTTVVLTAERPPAAAPDAASGPSSRPQAAAGPPPLAGIAGIRAIVAVASGKGGVGKSTVAANLAVALAQSGLSVGLLDADIYGPSVPRLMGLDAARPEAEGKQLLPLRAHGVATMSIGYLVPEDQAMVWRGPMVASAVSQLLGDVAWGALDVLVVDMPPGTGDAQLTLAQRVPLAGAVIVSTPQDLALIDARKA